MVKQLFLIKRKEGMSLEDFRKYYVERHAPMVKEAFPQISKYVINFVNQGKKATAYDAVTEISWPDIETLKKLSDSAIYREKIGPDEANFIAKEKTIIFLADELVAK